MSSNNIHLFPLMRGSRRLLRLNKKRVVRPVWMVPERYGRRHFASHFSGSHFFSRGSGNRWGKRSVKCASMQTILISRQGRWWTAGSGSCPLWKTSPRCTGTPPSWATLGKGPKFSQAFQYTHTHTHTHMHTHANTRMRWHMHELGHMHTHTHEHKHARTHSHTYTHTCTCTHTPTHTHMPRPEADQEA